MERNKHQPTSNPAENAAHERVDAEPRMQPKIYAGCLAAYNHGLLHGDWIYADQEPDYLMAEIQDMLEASPIQPAEEWAIHDYEGFGTFELSEYERLDTIARVAGGLALHGAAFAHWIHEVGSDAEDAIETFTDHYRGTYESYEDLAEQYLDDMGVNPHDIVPDWIRPYIRVDLDGLGHALAADLVAAEDRDGVHVFEAKR